MYQPTATSSDRQQERHAPAPGEEIRLVLDAGDQGEHAGREQAARGDARLRPARPEAAPGGVAMLGRHQHRPAPFAADREALDQAQDDQRDRRPDADLLVGRQQADQHGRDAHQDQAQHQQPLAPDPVAIMAEDDAADRPRDEAERIGGEGEQGAGQRIIVRERTAG